MGIDRITEILDFWDLRCKKFCPECAVAGSPNRTRSRWVVEDTAGDRYVLEEIEPAQRVRKREIAETLDLLDKQGLRQVLPYQKTAAGVHIQNIDRRFFQLLAYVEGVEVPRPSYIYQGWRAASFSGFLLDFLLVGREFPKTEPFSLKNYVYEIHDASRLYFPDVHKSLKPILAHLEEPFMGAHDALPIRLCHGDLHVLNCIWSETEIQKVIDWEFVGYKVETYDLANLLGCIGVESPDALGGELVLGIIRRLKDAGFLSRAGWAQLVDTIIALRFAWMSEWLRYRDVEMIELELAYMRILVAGREQLNDIWGI